MSLRVGIIGLPNVGKSTLFNALTQAGVAVASYPFTTIDPHVGVAAVPDARLEAVVDVVKSEKVIPAAVEFVDIAGLVRGAHQGEGLGNQFLANIREVETIAVVLRCFENADVPHTTDRLDPLDDLAVLDLELSLADLATVERRIERTQLSAKSRPKDFEWELATLAALKAHLAAGNPSRTFPGGYASAVAGGPGDTEAVRHRCLLGELFLLTNKPRLIVANIGESALPDGGEWAMRLAQVAETEGSLCLALCADCEAALSEWDVEDAQVYRAELGMEETGLNRLVWAGYRLLNLISFFTITGGEVVRAWSLKRGQNAWDAAGQVHTDIQQGFIRADVVTWGDLVTLGSLAAAREGGKLRSEGRDYLVEDGDVIHFHFHN
jgi:ribosome-binding ATPase